MIWLHVSSVGCTCKNTSPSPFSAKAKHQFRTDALPLALYCIVIVMHILLCLSKTNSISSAEPKTPKQTATTGVSQFLQTIGKTASDTEAKDTATGIPDGFPLISFLLLECCCLITYVLKRVQCS